MNKNITLLLCVLSLTLFAQNEQTIGEKAETDQSTYTEDNLKTDMDVVFAEKSAERRNSEVEFIAWSNKLHAFLLESDNDFAQAITLAKMISGVETARFLANLHDKPNDVDTLNDLSYQPIADMVNQMINQPEISAKTLDILTQICFSDKMADHCHTNVLLEKRMQQDTGNLQSYMRPFDLAVTANNTRLKNQLIQLMANAQYSRTVLGITANMRELIDEFIANNPIPKSATDNMVADYKKLSGISPDKKAQLDQLIPDYMPSFIKFSYNFLNDVPPYRTVLDFCKSNINATTDCRDIAKILIQKSNSMIDKGVGHSLLIATYESEQNQAGIDVAQQLHAKFRRSYECILELNNEKYFIDKYFDPNYQQINFTSTDEFETMIQLAELRYGELKTQGVEAAVNPDTCFERS